MSDDRRERGAPRDVLFLLRIVHAAMVVSILVYGGVMVVVTRAPPGDAVPGATTVARGEPPPVMATILAAAAAASLLAVLILRSRMARQRETAPAAGDQQARKLALGRYYTGSIVSWALTESVAIFGLVLGMLHRDTAYFLPFGGVSLAVMLLLAPRRGHMDALAPGSDGL